MKRIYWMLLIPILVSACKLNPNAKHWKTGKEGNDVPSIGLMRADKSFFNTRNIPKGKPLVLFYMSTTCPYCRVQMRKMLSNPELIKDVNLTIIGTDNYDAMKSFYDKYKLKDYPNISFGIDTGYVFPKYFQSATVPFTAIYDHDKKLAMVFMGTMNERQLGYFKPTKSVAQTGIKSK